MCVVDPDIGHHLTEVGDPDALRTIVSGRHLNGESFTG
jgi:hypothetical protein